MDWNKMLGDMSIVSGKPISEGTIMFGMLIDLFKSTNNPDLKKAIENQFIFILTNLPK